MSIKCPFTSKCHGKLSDELKEARKRHQETVRTGSETVASLKDENLLLKNQLNMVSAAVMEHLSGKGRKAVRRYSTNADRPQRCKSCEHIEYIRDSSARSCRSFCSKDVRYAHPVDRDHGSCPSHSDLVENSANGNS